MKQWPSDRNITQCNTTSIYGCLPLLQSALFWTQLQAARQIPQPTPAPRQARSRTSPSAASALQLGEGPTSTCHHRRAEAPCAWFFTLLVLSPRPTSISSLQWNLPSGQSVPSCHLSCEPIVLIEVVEKQAEIWSIIKLKQNTESLGVLCMCLSCVHKP